MTEMNDKITIVQSDAGVVNLSKGNGVPLKISLIRKMLVHVMQDCELILIFVVDLRIYFHSD
jgi:hypothetical protein